MDELEKISPELSKIKKENPFRVPDNYFDDFSARLQIRLEAEKMVVPIKQNRFIQFLKPALGLAASFALIFMLVYWPLKSFMPDQVASSQIQDELSEDEFLSVVEGIDENSFFALLNEQDEGIKFSDEDLISYVGNNISDYEIYSEIDYK